MNHKPTPTDLDPQEARLAGLFQASAEHEAEGLGQRVEASAGAARARMMLAARSAGATTAAPAAIGSRAIGSRAIGSWAVAAGLLIAIGLGGFFLLHGVGPETPIAQTIAVEPMNTGLAPREDIVLREDTALSLFHDIETFGNLGVDPDDLLALGE